MNSKSEKETNTHSKISSDWQNQTKSSTLCFGNLCPKKERKSAEKRTIFICVSAETAHDDSLVEY